MGHVFINKNVLFPLDVSKIKGYGQKHSKYNQGEKQKNFSQSWKQSKHWTTSNKLVRAQEKKDQ
jgi:hypothetical protein